MSRGDTHGMFPTEREIMDRWDAGESVEAIATRTGRFRTSVREVVQRYHITGGDRSADEVRAGSTELLSAIREHHPEIFA